MQEYDNVKHNIDYIHTLTSLFSLKGILLYEKVSYKLKTLFYDLRHLIYRSISDLSIYLQYLSIYRFIYSSF